MRKTSWTKKLVEGINDSSSYSFGTHSERQIAKDFQTSETDVEVEEQNKVVGMRESYLINKSCLIPSEDVKSKFKCIILPDHRFIKIWDQTIVMLLLFSSLAVPYQIGVSMGYYLVHNDWWFSLNVIIDALFMIDTFLYFFRAYRDKKTTFLVISQKKIRRVYLKSYFVLNFISSLFPSLAFRILLKQFDFDIYSEKKKRGADNLVGRQIIFLLPSLLRLLRFIRTQNIISSSRVLRAIWESKFFTPYRIELLKHIFFLYLTSHWIACIWCFLAFYESQTFGPDIIQGSNWIASWYNKTYGEDQATQGHYISLGGLNPVGWENHVERYVLALFWSVQTITSIGYGNIMPFNLSEWMLSCTLMLFSGIIWGFMISSLLTIMRRESANSFSISKLYDANEMIKAFHTDEESREISDEKKREFGLKGKGSRKKRRSLTSPHFFEEPEKDLRHDVGRRIRKFVLDQMERDENIKSCFSSLNEEFLAFGSLSQELQRMSSYLIFKSYLNAVPYLSSRYLNVDQQSLISMKCKLRCFAAGETFTFNSASSYDNENERGIFILIRGYGFVKSSHRSGPRPISYLKVGDAFGFEQVLIEDKDLKESGEIKFPLFTRILFIPRNVVLDTFDRNPLVWKDCGRWLYFRYLLKTKFNPVDSLAKYSSRKKE